MTTTTRPTHDALIDALADAILNCDDDSPFTDLAATIAAAFELLTLDAYIELCAALEICPDHQCDIHICDDDDLPCSDNS